MKGPTLVIPVLAALGILSLRSISGGTNAYNVGYLFALIGSFGIALYLHYNKRKAIKLDNLDYSTALEALKMEHSELLQQFNQTIWAIVILFTGGVVAGLIPIATSPQPDSIALEGVGISLLNHVLLIIYFVIWGMVRYSVSASVEAGEPA